MSYPEALGVFFILLSGIIVVPGMDMIFVLANALTGGRRAGIAATFGIMTGGALHTAFGAFAVVALSRLVPGLYGPMLILGSLYMMWIGWTLIRSSTTVEEVEGLKSRTLPAIFVQAIITCILNPKAWLFVLAVYPQFIKPDFGPLWMQALVIGMMVAAMQLTVYGGLGLMAAQGRDAMIGNPNLTIWSGRVAGLLLIAAAIYALWHGWQGL